MRVPPHHFSALHFSVDGLCANIACRMRTPCLDRGRWRGCPGWATRLGGRVAEPNCQRAKRRIEEAVSKRGPQHGHPACVGTVWKELLTLIRDNNPQLFPIYRICGTIILGASWLPTIARSASKRLPVGRLLLAAAAVPGEPPSSPAKPGPIAVNISIVMHNCG